MCVTFFLYIQLAYFSWTKLNWKIVSCGISYQAGFTWFNNSFLVVAGLTFLNKQRLIISHRFSIGYKSGERAGQGITFTLFLSKNPSVDLAT